MNTGSSQPCCAITGAAGYLGSAIAGYFSDRGWSVVEFARRKGTPAPGRISVSFDLESAIDPEIFRRNSVRALVHCAYDFRPVRWQDIERINVQGSIRVLQAAKQAGVERLVFISSISAFEGCSSLYGKAKLAIERAAAEVGACIVRPGLIYGHTRPGGMFGALQNSVTRSRMIPLIGSGEYPQYLVHVDDLCELIYKFVCGEFACPSAPLVAASGRPWPMRDLLRALAAAQQKTLRLVPVPWQLIWLPLKMLEVLRVAAPFRSDSVISLVRQNPTPDFSAALQTGCRFRDFAPDPPRPS